MPLLSRLSLSFFQKIGRLVLWEDLTIPELQFTETQENLEIKRSVNAMGILKGIFKSRDKPKNATSGSAYRFFIGGSSSGKNVNERSAMQMTAVYSCVRILSEAVASLPLHVYKYNSEGGKEKAVKHPLYYQYNTSKDDAPTMKGSMVNLKPSDVLHIPGLGFDGLVGYSPIAMAKNAIGMAIACEEYGAKFFANGATPGGILEHPGTVKDPQRVRDSWTSAFGGSSNANKVAVLEEGMKYTPISISPEQTQFLETRKFQINEIARIFRVPPHMVGDLEKSSFSNIEQQSLEFVKYTLDPWVARWEQAIVRSLFSADEKTQYFVKFNVDGLLRGDYQSRMNGYAIGRQNGWMSANDIRELENLDRIPEEEGGDLYLINGNMTKLKDAGIFAGKENEPNEEVLEVEEPKGSESGDTDGNGGENTVPKRHHRRG